ncbi:VOC family protein [Streptomyces glomeratus]|uniref:VOC family protein n=1 Tax=Streptomyces glomeratus TaxID=284452 RepID=A0ABP6LSM9_9ACTN|nr:VOC family protein [Streptomyces glomeratus]MCF1507581.1 VOC family protein [Streptomyces glomeratus]
MTEARRPAGPNDTTHARHSPGTPCWASLMVHGMAVTQEFYGALFGWEFRPGPRPLGPYVRAVLNGHEVAGIGRLPPDRHLPVAWTPYFASDDVDATAETIRSCGGTVAVGPLDAAGAGRLAIASDPMGAVFGIWQAAGHLGRGLTGVPGTPAWNELLTYDTEGVAKFYRTVFASGQEPVLSGGPDRVTVYIEGRPVAGIHGFGSALPPDRGPHWMTYFQVTDVDAAAVQVAALGGHVVRPWFDTALGRVVTVADPEGATFSVVSRAD